MRITMQNRNWLFYYEISRRLLFRNCSTCIVINYIISLFLFEIKHRIRGTCAAISAARLGLKVALIQDRTVLGGNNSSEVRVHLGGRINLSPYPALGNLVNEIGPVKRGNAQPASFYEDQKKLDAVVEEKNISLFLNYRANGVEKEGNRIKAVHAVNIENSKELRFEAPLFADCTGDATIGALAGADFMMGREGKSDYGEPTAPLSSKQHINGLMETRKRE